MDQDIQVLFEVVPPTLFRAAQTEERDAWSEVASGSSDLPIHLPPGVSPPRLLLRAESSSGELFNAEASRIGKSGQPQQSSLYISSAESQDAAAELILRLKAHDRIRNIEALAYVRTYAPRTFGKAKVVSQPYLDGQYGVGLKGHANRAGGSGDQVGVVLLDTGWYPPHPDLPASIVEFTLPLPPSAKPVVDGTDPRHHGNAMLGVICARRNGKGIDGIVPRAFIQIGLHQPADRESVTRSTLPDLLVEAAKRARTGDVLVLALEAIKLKPHGRKLLQSNYLGLEAWHACRRIFQRAEGKGVHVVCAAGNGLASRLDDFCSPGFYPSPALVVGGSLSSGGGRIKESNWGDRIDLHSWGENVSTFTVDDYTSEFNGTSSATAIVGGVVAALSSHVRAHTGRIITPAQMRKLLVSTGTRPIRGLGVQPNVEAAVKRLEAVSYDLTKI